MSLLHIVIFAVVSTQLQARDISLSRNIDFFNRSKVLSINNKLNDVNNKNRTLLPSKDKNKPRSQKNNYEPKLVSDKSCYSPDLPLIQVTKEDLDSSRHPHPEVPLRAERNDVHGSTGKNTVQKVPSRHSDYLSCLNQPVAVDAVNQREKRQLVTHATLPKSYIHQVARVVDDKGNVTYQWRDENNQLQSMTEFEYIRLMSMYFEAFIQYLIFGSFFPAGGGWHIWQYSGKKLPRRRTNQKRTVFDSDCLQLKVITLNDGCRLRQMNSETESITGQYDRQEMKSESKYCNTYLQDSLFIQCPLSVPILDKKVEKQEKINLNAEKLSGRLDVDFSSEQKSCFQQGGRLVNDTIYHFEREVEESKKHCNQCMKFLSKKDFTGLGMYSDNGDTCYECSSINLRKNLIVQALLATSVNVQQEDVGCAVIGSSGLELIQGVLPTTVKTVSDIDLLCDDEKTANSLIYQINDSFQKLVYHQDYRLCNFSVNFRSVGKGKGKPVRAPTGGQITVFCNNSPWFSVDVSVKTDWMKEIDLSSEKYITLVNINYNDANLGSVPVLSLFGYTVLDSLVLSTEIEEFEEFKNTGFESDKLIRFLIYTQKTLEKISQREQFYRLVKNTPVVNEIVSRYKYLVSLLMGSRRTLLNKIEYWVLDNAYSVSSLGVDVDKKRLSRLALNSEVNGTRLDVKELQILLAKDFKIKEIEIDNGGDCFYQAVADAINSSKKAKSAFLTAFSKVLHDNSLHDDNITMVMVREFIHEWLAKAAATAANHPEQLGLLISPPPGVSLDEILKKGYIKNTAPKPSPTDYYGWTNLLYPIVLATGLPIMVLSPDISRQGIRKAPHTFKLANYFFAPDLVNNLIVNVPELINTTRGETLFGDLSMFLVHSGADHYHSAEPLGDWTYFMDALVGVEDMLSPESSMLLNIVDVPVSQPMSDLRTDVDLEDAPMSMPQSTTANGKESGGFHTVNAVEFCGIDNDIERSSYEQRNTSKKKKKKRKNRGVDGEGEGLEASGFSSNLPENMQSTVTIEDLDSSEVASSDQAVMEHDSIQEKNIVGSKKKKKKKKKNNNVTVLLDSEGHSGSKIEPELYPSKNEIEEQVEDNKNALISSLLEKIKNEEEIDLKMSKPEKESLAKEIFDRVISHLKIPFKTGDFVMNDSYRISLSKCNEEWLNHIQLSSFLGHTNAPLIIAVLKMNTFDIDKNSLDDQIFIIRYLNEAANRGSKQALNWLFLFSAMTGSPYAFSSSLQASAMLDSNIKNNSLDEYPLVLAVTSGVMKKIVSNSTIVSEAIAPLALRHLALKAQNGNNIYESDWRIIDELFPRDIGLQSKLTPHLLFSQQKDDFLYDVQDGADSVSDDSQDLRLQKAFTTIINLTYRGYFFLQTDDNERALECFLKSSILYTLLFLSDKSMPNLSIASGLASVYQTFHLFQYFTEEASSASSPFILQWMKFFKVTGDKLKSISQQHSLYAMMAENKIEGDEPDNVLAFLLTYVRVKKTKYNPVVDAIEELSGEIKEQITFFSIENKESDFNHKMMGNAKKYAGKTTVREEDKHSNMTAVKYLNALLKERVRGDVLEYSKHEVNSQGRYISAITDVNSISQDLNYIAPRINAFSRRVNAWLNVELDSLDRVREQPSLIMEGVDLLRSINFTLIEKVFFLKSNLKSLTVDERRTYHTNKSHLVYNGLRIIANIHKLKNENGFNDEFLHQVFEFQRYGVNKNSFDYFDRDSSNKMHEFLRELISLVDPVLYSDKSAGLQAKLFAFLNIQKNIILEHIDTSNIEAVVNLINSYLQYSQDVEDVVNILTFLIDADLLNESFMRLLKKTANKLVLIMIQSVEYDEQRVIRDKISVLVSRNKPGKKDAADYWDKLLLLMDEDINQTLEYQESRANAIYDELMAEENHRVEQENLELQRLEQELNSHRLEKCRIYREKHLAKEEVTDKHVQNVLIKENEESEQDNVDEEKDKRYIDIDRLIRSERFKEAIEELETAEDQSDGDTLFILRLKSLKVEALRKYLLEMTPLLHEIDQWMHKSFVYASQYRQAKEKCQLTDPYSRKFMSLFPKIPSDSLLKVIEYMDELTENINDQNNLFYLLRAEIQKSIEMLGLFLEDVDGCCQSLETIELDLKVMFSHYAYISTINTKIERICQSLSSASEDQIFLAVEALKVKKARLLSLSTNEDVSEFDTKQKKGLLQNPEAQKNKHLAEGNANFNASQKETIQQNPEAQKNKHLAEGNASFNASQKETIQQNPEAQKRKHLAEGNANFNASQKETTQQNPEAQKRKHLAEGKAKFNVSQKEITQQNPEVQKRKQSSAKLKKIKRRANIFSSQIPNSSEVEQLKNKVFPKM